MLMTDEPSPYLFKTNTGNSKTLGLELFAEYELVQSPGFELSLFTATSYFDAEYVDSQLRDGDQNIDISGNSLETVPNWMSRNGLQLAYQKLTGIFQHSYVGKSYSDAFNTQNPSANGAKGLVPAYHIFDLNLAYRYSPQLLLTSTLGHPKSKTEDFRQVFLTFVQKEGFSELFSRGLKLYFYRVYPLCYFYGFLWGKCGLFFR